MATALRPLPRNPYEIFRRDLEKESPRAAYWLESMIYGMMAQMDGMTEETALELACKIVAGPTNPSQANTAQPGRRNKRERMPAAAVNVYA
jgi:hypothetical protein